MEKTNDHKGRSSILSSNVFQMVFVGMLVVGSFFLGSLWTKVQVLEKGIAGGNPSAAAPSAAAPQVAAVAPKVLPP